MDLSFNFRVKNIPTARYAIITSSIMKKHFKGGN